MKLEEIQSGQSLSGVEPTRIVTVVATVKVGEGPSTQLIYRTPDGAMKERFLGRADEDSIGVASVEHPFSFDGDGSASGDHSKTCYHRDQILSFLENSEDLSPGFEELVEGTESQAVAVHDRNGNALVLRLSSSDDGFRMDQYAARTFGGFLPIPNVVRIGKSDKHAYYCLTTQAQGIQSNKLTLDELRAALANIHKALADIFKADISSMTGYGRPVLPEGDAAHPSWRSVINRSAGDLEKYRRHAANLDLRPSLVDHLIFQYERHLNYGSETRCLLHGDPAHDNMLIKDGQVTAIIDWSLLCYGDWMSDFATISFWWPEVYGDPVLFAHEFHLDSANIRERTALYWAMNALKAVEWTDRHKSEIIYQWLHDNLEQRLL